MVIKAKIDKSNIEKACKAVSKGGLKAVDRAKSRALRSGAAAFTSASKGGAPSVYKIKPADLKSMTSTDKDSLMVKSRRLTIGVSPSHFGMTPTSYTSQKGIPVKKRKKMTATVKKGNKKQMPHAFIANPGAINGGHAMMWERKGKGKQIQPVRSLSAAQMLTNPDVEEAVMKAINETLDKRLDHELKRMGI